MSLPRIASPPEIKKLLLEDLGIRVEACQEYPPTHQLELLVEDFVWGIDVWRLMAVSTANTVWLNFSVHGNFTK